MENNMKNNTIVITMIALVVGIILGMVIKNESSDISSIQQQGAARNSITTLDAKAINCPDGQIFAYGQCGQIIKYTKEELAAYNDSKVQALVDSLIDTVPSVVSNKKYWLAKLMCWLAGGTWGIVTPYAGPAYNYYACYNYPE